MDKNTILAIYGKAHVCALTSENIKSTFRKTGIWPFDPSVMTEEMLALSKESLSEAHLPILPDNPAVNVLATMFRKLAKISEAEELCEDAPDSLADVISEALLVVAGYQA